MREAPSQEAFLARLEEEGLSSYSRDGKLQGIELDGKKYRFKRTIGVDLEQHEWTASKTQDKKVDSLKEQVEAEVPPIESSKVQEVEAAATEQIQAPPKEEPVQNQHESIPSKEAETPKAPAEDLPKEDLGNPQHLHRSSELSSLRQRKIERGRDGIDPSEYRRA